MERFGESLPASEENPLTDLGLELQSTFELISSFAASAYLWLSDEDTSPAFSYGKGGVTTLLRHFLWDFVLIIS